MRKANKLERMPKRKFTGVQHEMARQWNLPHYTVFTHGPFNSLTAGAQIDVRHP
jgi:hypothetical protein